MKLDSYGLDTLTHRTVVVRPLRGGRRIRLFDKFYIVWEKLPRRVRRFAAWWVQPRVLLTLSAIVVCLFVIGFHYYSVFSAEIDSRLKRDVFNNSARIVAAPVTLKIGDQFSVEELSGYMDEAGYSLSSGDQPVAAQGSYSVGQRTVDVIPTAYAASKLGLLPARIEIDSQRRVSALTELRGGRQLSSVVLEGVLLASMKDGDRRKSIEVQFSEIPAPLISAITATEDRRFFAHSGVDWRGIIRALFIDLRRGELVQGGSTITQQLIKNAFLTRERTWARKVKEAAMALILESRLSKQDIFALYCNDVYLGQCGRYAIRGFAEAAQVYFDKKLNQLTLGESAFLAGLCHGPNRYSARRDPSHALARRKEVLDAMVGLGAISSEEAERAQLETLQFVKHEAKDDLGLSYFIDYTERFVEERYGWQALASRTRLNTTLDMRLQQAAYNSVAVHAERIDRLIAPKGKKQSPLQPVQAALVALDPHSGEILAMIGGRNYDESQLNRATDALRQPGSTFKPFIYASALSRRAYTAASLLSDRPQNFSYDGGRSEYKPTDYHGGFSNRDVTLGEALARSLNVPTVQLAEQMGISTIAEFAETCGLPKPRLYLSTALGASEVALLDLAAGYTTFANDGTARRPTPVKGICWPEKDDSEAVLTKTVRALSPQTAFLMTDMLRAVLNGGTGSRARTLGFKGDAAGKTGTSRDGWFVGYTPNLLCAVWVGFDDNRDLGLKGSDSALPIWVDFMKRALEIRPELGGKFTQPGGLTSALIDPTTGMLACEKCPKSQRMLFLSGTEPFAMCTHDLPDEQTLAASQESESPASQSGDDEISNDVTLEVCAETGLLPSSDCRTLKKRTVTWKDLPIGTCSPDLHHKAVLPPDDKHP